HREIKTKYDDSLLEIRRLQDRIDSMEFIRRNINTSSTIPPSANTSRILTNTYSSGSNSSPSSYLAPTSRRQSMSRFTSVERELLPPPYTPREPSVARRISRDYSTERWQNNNSNNSNTNSLRRDSSNDGNKISLTNSRRGPDRWSSSSSSTVCTEKKPNLRVVRDDFDSEKIRNDLLQKENERLRTIRKKNLLNTNDINSIRSQTSSPLLYQEYNNNNNNNNNHHTPENNMTESITMTKSTYNSNNIF
ncbi:unnamed protein product, partial [Didymodactylos carnosus]